MRRTITTLIFLAVGGLTCASHAADDSRGYYASGQSTYRISDDDDGPAANASQSGVAKAGGQPQQSGQEKNALYVAERGAVGNDVLQASFFDNGGNCCQNNCGCGQNTCLSDSCNCDCSTNVFRLEWLGWFTRGRNTPPLVTTSDGGTARTDAGVVGLSSTTVLYGDDKIGTNLRNGGRATLSHLFNDGLTTGTVRFWGIEDGSETFATTSADFPIIGRPFFNALLGQNDAFLVAFPGVTDPGSIRVRSKNDLIGLDAWGSRNWYSDCCSSIDILAGYQFARLDDSITIDSLSTSVDPGAVVPVGTTLGISDSFRTKNEFHGGSLGLIGRSYRGAITLEGLFKLGLGNMHQTVITGGSTTITPPGGVATTSPGGILAQATNSGTFSRDRFNYVPEINANLIYNINQSWRATVGYSFIYWNNVVLAGNQIDTNVNLSTTAGPAVPVVKFQRSDFWVQGISLGGDYRW